MMRSLFLGVLLIFIGEFVIAQSLYFPPTGGGEWENLDPSSINYCPDRVDSLYDFLEEQKTKAFVLLKDGRIVLEQYFNDFGRDSLWVWFSAGKSLRATLVGIAQAEGLLSLEDKTSEHLGQGWTSLTNEQEAQIKVWHQMTMTTGLDETVDDPFCTDPECLEYKTDPGTRWFYHNAPYSLLRNVLEAATGENINQWTNSRIKRKIGMTSGFWFPVAFNTFYFSRARDMARFGLMIQAEGAWNGTTIVDDPQFMSEMLNSSQAMNPAYGYLWWLNGKDKFIPPGIALSFPGPLAPDAPQDAVTAAGALGQFCSISKEKGLVLVRMGEENSGSQAPINLLNDIWKHVLDLECNTTNTIEKSARKILVYPNPAKEFLYFDHIPGQIKSVELVNTLGHKFTAHQIDNKLDLKNLRPGMYYLRVDDGINTQSVPFTVVE